MAELPAILNSIENGVVSLRVIDSVLAGWMIETEAHLKELRELTDKAVGARDIKIGYAAAIGDVILLLRNSSVFPRSGLVLLFESLQAARFGQSKKRKKGLFISAKKTRGSRAAFLNIRVPHN